MFEQDGLVTRKDIESKLPTLACGRLVFVTFLMKRNQYVLLKDEGDERQGTRRLANPYTHAQSFGQFTKPLGRSGEEDTEAQSPERLMKR
jgi:hypothetical protein